MSSDYIYKIQRTVCGQNEFYRVLEAYCKQENLDLEEALNRLNTRQKFYHKTVTFSIQPAHTTNKFRPKPKQNGYMRAW